MTFYIIHVQLECVECHNYFISKSWNSELVTVFCTSYELIDINATIPSLRSIIIIETPFNLTMYSSAAALENFLLNHPADASVLGILLYLPCLTLLFVLWMAQTLVSIVLYLICYPLTSTNQQAYSQQNGSDEADRDGATSTESTPCSVRILQINTFWLFGRFWTRKPLMEDMIRSISPDVISVNEAIRSRFWSFGTVRMIESLWDVHCDSIVSSPYNCLKEQYPLLFECSFAWDHVIGELQLALNILFLLSFFRRFMWKVALKGDRAWHDALILFTGLPVQIGNALIFRGNHLENPSILTLSAHRTANRALYIHPADRRKRLWIVNTHLTAAAQSRYDVERQQIGQIESILEWMEKAIDVHPADAMVICGDFNATPDSKLYRLMISNGFRSCGAEYIGNTQHCTYESLTWTFADGIDEDIDPSRPLILDYVWIKPLRDGVTLGIEDCRIVGKNYTESTHRGEDIKVFPSDHLGVFVTLSW